MPGPTADASPVVTSAILSPSDILKVNKTNLPRLFNESIVHLFANTDDLHLAAVKEALLKLDDKSIERIKETLFAKMFQLFPDVEAFKSKLINRTATHKLADDIINASISLKENSPTFDFGKAFNVNPVPTIKKQIMSSSALTVNTVKGNELNEHNTQNQELPEVQNQEKVQKSDKNLLAEVKTEQEQAEDHQIEVQNNQGRIQERTVHLMESKEQDIQKIQIEEINNLLQDLSIKSASHASKDSTSLPSSPSVFLPPKFHQNTSDIGAISKKLDKMNSKMDAMMQKTTEIQESQEQMRSVQESILSRLEKVEQSWSITEDRSKKNEKDVQMLTQQCKSLTEKQDDLSKFQASLETVVTRDIANFSSKIKETEKEVQQNYRKISDLDQNLSSTIANDKREWNDKITELQRAQTQLATDVADIKEKIADIKEKTATMKTEFDPDVTIVAVGLHKYNSEDYYSLLDVSKQCISCIDSTLAERIERVKRMGDRDGRNGIVKIQMKNSNDKIKILKDKKRLEFSPSFRKVYLRSSQSHESRLIDLNMKTLLDTIPTLREELSIENGRLKPRRMETYSPPQNAYNQFPATPWNSMSQPHPFTQPSFQPPPAFSSGGMPFPDGMTRPVQPPAPFQSYPQPFQMNQTTEPRFFPRAQYQPRPYFQSRSYQQNFPPLVQSATNYR